MTEMRAQQSGYKTTAGILLRTVENDSVAYYAGLRDGDIIKEVNKKPVLKVGNEKFVLEWTGDPHWRVAAADTFNVLRLLQRAAAVEVSFRHHGDGDKTELVPTAGFGQALASHQ